MLNKEYSRHYLGFDSRDFHETPPLSLLAHCLQKASNYHRPIMESTLFYGCICVSFRGNFLKLHTKHSTCIACKLLVWNCNQPITKGTLLVEENTFKAMSRLPLVGFYRSPHLTLHAHCQQTMSVWLQSANNERFFNCISPYLHCNISASIGGTFLKCHM